MPKGVALRREEDPQEWIDECLNCPLEECVDCRYQASAYHCVESIRGCLPDDKFICMYNTDEKPRTMVIAFNVPTAFIMAGLDQLKLPWRAGEKRPVLSRRNYASKYYQYTPMYGAYKTLGRGNIAVSGDSAALRDSYDRWGAASAAAENAVTASGERLAQARADYEKAYAAYQADPSSGRDKLNDAGMKYEEAAGMYNADLFVLQEMIELTGLLGRQSNRAAERERQEYYNANPYVLRMDDTAESISGRYEELKAAYEGAAKTLSETTRQYEADSDAAAFGATVDVDKSKAAYDEARAAYGKALSNYSKGLDLLKRRLNKEIRRARGRNAQEAAIAENRRHREIATGNRTAADVIASVREQSGVDSILTFEEFRKSDMARSLPIGSDENSKAMESIDLRGQYYRYLTGIGLTRAEADAVMQVQPLTKADAKSYTGSNNVKEDAKDGGAEAADDGGDTGRAGSGGGLVLAERDGQRGGKNDERGGESSESGLGQPGGGSVVPSDADDAGPDVSEKSPGGAEPERLTDDVRKAISEKFKEAKIKDWSDAPVSQLSETEASSFTQLMDLVRRATGADVYLLNIYFCNRQEKVFTPANARCIMPS